MSQSAGRNVGHSVFQRLKNLAGPENGSLPVGLSAAFSKDEQKQQQWHAFVQKFDAHGAPDDLHDAISAISEFLMPVVLPTGDVYRHREWIPEQGWKE